MIAAVLRRWVPTCAVLLLLNGAQAEGQDVQIADVSRPGEQEPITPVPPVPAEDPRKVSLGERLFKDPRLSHDGTRACMSCHDVSSNGADAADRDRGVDGSLYQFNTSTVFNAALSFRIGWEGRLRSLEEHIETSLNNPILMGTSVDEVLVKLKTDEEYDGLFRKAYGHAPDRDSLFNAIATYERTLLTPGSRFDRWLQGDAKALSPDELDGYRLFKSLGCVSCHQGVNVGGNLFERHGIFRPLASPKPEIVRVPSLRNVATTPPYFHDGSAPTLGDAVRQMGAAQLDRKLSDQQVDTIIAFLETLTGTYRGTPVVAARP
ncbi:cytochrome-c peroxidase [Methyloferula stellata]|uniref:cytochrome-c peroxidase n=1 Tax=Methyloferula stellata TaxID=876270 RepID=UPI0003A5D74B|nr:cytochrome c peroxidase [Methyloferula stellata]